MVCAHACSILFVQLDAQTAFGRFDDVFAELFLHLEQRAPVLPKPQHMLGAKAHRRDGNPAGGTEHDGLRARFHQPNDVGIQTYGGHCHNDEELACELKGLESGHVNAGCACHGGDNRCAQEQYDERWQRALAPAVFFSREATQSASTNVMGIIAKVRVSFTMVA